MHNHQIGLNWIKGTFGSAVAVVSTFQEQLDFWTRYSFTCVGGMIAVISLYRLCKNKPNK